MDADTPKPNKPIALAGAAISLRLQDAVTFALSLHSSQWRKGGQVPYAAHLFAVASLVMEHGGSEDEVIGALLHDAAEDQGGRQVLSQIAERYGERVADIVAGCSDSFADEEKLPWRRRKIEFIQSLVDQSSSVHLVVMADKLHNLRSVVTDYRELQEALWPRFQGRREGTLWYYRELIKTFQKLGYDSPMLSELRSSFSALESLMALSADGPEPGS